MLCYIKLTECMQRDARRKVVSDPLYGACRYVWFCCIYTFDNNKRTL